MKIIEYDEHLSLLISCAIVTDRLTQADPGELRIRNKWVGNVAEDTSFHL